MLILNWWKLYVDLSSGKIGRLPIVHLFKENLKKKVVVVCTAFRREKLV
jgi:hypothetical protein